MLTKIEMLFTTVTAAQLIAATDPDKGLDLGEFTVGWHDEWMWTPDYWKMGGNDATVSSNLPVSGIGGNSYSDFTHCMRHMQEILAYHAIAAEPFDADTTEAFAFLQPNGDLQIWEFRVVPMSRKAHDALIEAANEARALDDQAEIDHKQFQQDHSYEGMGY